MSKARGGRREERAQGFWEEPLLQCSEQATGGQGRGWEPRGRWIVPQSHGTLDQVGAGEAQARAPGVAGRICWGAGGQGKGDPGWTQEAG